MSAQPALQGTVQRVSLAEAFAHAQLLQRSLRLTEAETVYGEILQQIPGEPNALHFLGILRHQQGDASSAARLIREAAERMPHEAGPWINLGNVLVENGDFEQASLAYQRAIDLAPASVQPFNNLGILHTRLRQWQQAEACFLHGLRMVPDSAYLHLNYSCMLQGSGRLREAVAHGMQSVSLDPKSATARKLLGMSYYLLGEEGNAIRTFQEWHELEPDNPEAVHHLAALGVGEVPARASDRYVEQLFDGFAESFDQQLQSLGYRAPAVVHEALVGAAARLPGDAVILDAGCGTGLCGALIRPLAKSLHGVDLSNGMLERARTRGLYDALHQAELTAFLRSVAEPYHAIVSADTLCYFGDLGDVLRAARNALSADGLLVFTLEALTDSGQGFKLQFHGRYAHASSYVEQALAGAGFRLESIEQSVLRHELVEPVQGWVVVATPAGPAQPLPAGALRLAGSAS